MDTKIEKDEAGFYILPDPAPAETVEVFPGHVIVLSREDLEARKSVDDAYERIVSTTTWPDGVVELAEAAPSIDSPSAGRGWFDFFKKA